MVLQLSKNTLASLYQINNQSIWFLAWILKQNRLWPDLTKEVLETPFTVEINYWKNGQIYYVSIKKNNKYHGISRGWHENGQLRWVKHWKDGKEDGINCGWYENGQLCWEEYWKDGKEDGLECQWNENGQLYWEHHWKNGKKYIKNHFFKKI